MCPLPPRPTFPFLRRLPTVFTPLLFLLASPVTPAQDAADPIKEMRESFLRQLGASSAPIDEIYIKALKDLESEMATKKDYETALLAQRRRMDLESAKPASGRPSDSRISLVPVKARTTGRISREGGAGTAADSLTSWKTVGSSATWDIQNTPPGTYLVQAHLACGNPVPFDSNGDSTPDTVQLAGGTFFFEEVTNLAGSAENRLSTKVKSTGGWDTYAVQNLGEIKLQRSSATLRAVATQVEPLGLMNLRRIDLIPTKGAASPLPPGISTPGEPPLLTQARETHYAKLALLRAPVAESYIKELRTLAEKLPKQDRQALVPLIDQEIAYAAKASQPSPPPSPSATQAQGASDSEDPPSTFTTLRGAKWSEDPRNRGDAFMVEHEGKKFPVRLFFVTCPVPATGDDASAAYFGISKEQAGFVGQEAAQFTAKYLQDRDLTLFTTTQKDPDGSTPAIVLLKGFGFFERILVARGLAMIRADGASASPDLSPRPGKRRSPEDSVYQSLRPVEDRAKSEGRGAWSFSGKKTQPLPPLPPKNPTPPIPANP